MLEEEINNKIESILRDGIEQAGYSVFNIELINFKKILRIQLTRFTYLFYYIETNKIQYKVVKDFQMVEKEIDDEFISLNSLKRISNILSYPGDKLREFDGIRLTEGKRITKNDREQINKYVANIEQKNSGS